MPYYHHFQRLGTADVQQQNPSSYDFNCIRAAPERQVVLCFPWCQGDIRIAVAVDSCYLPPGLSSVWWYLASPTLQTMQRLVNNFYVDDLIKFVNNEEQTLNLISAHPNHNFSIHA